MGQMSLLSSAVESKKRRVSVGGVNVPSELHNCGTIVMHICGKKYQES